MASESDDNPLLEKQREKAGSTTFKKYNYQYHWALYRILEEHDNIKEYAVFVELHEDVVLSNSLNSNTARFEFNQVKTNAKTFNCKDLTKLKNNSSILGKLISNKSGKIYSDKIDKLNLVTTSGFNLKQQNPGLALQILSLSDLEASELDAIKLCIKKELGLDEIPQELFFVKSNLNADQFQEVLVGEISALISRLYPESKYNSITIYQTLIDELNSKGMITTDYSDWDTLLKKKALTSETVTKLFDTFTANKSEATISSQLDQIVSELNINSMKSVTMRQEFDRYRQNKFINKSAGLVDAAEKIKASISIHENNCNDQISILLSLVKSDLSQKVKDQFLNENQINAAIICEFLTK